MERLPPLELLDPTLRDSCSRNEVIRCLHIGLLYVEENPDNNRPTTTSTVLMLNRHSIPLSSPLQIVYWNLTEKNMPVQEYPSTNQAMPGSVNHMSITDLYPR